MTTTLTPQQTTARLDAIVTEIADAIAGVVTKHGVTYEEYRVATDWLTRAGGQMHEIPLLLDVFLATAVDNVNNPTGGGTESNVEGPFYVPGAPRLEHPYVLGKRDSDGETLIFSGTVTTADGTPLHGALLDVWQANGAGEYSFIHEGVPDYNLRGQLLADVNGRFQFETVVPSPYEIPVSGATGELLAALGRPTFRPGHIHLKITHADARPLTTQIYFEGDPWIESDVVGAVKPPLITRLNRHQD
jgi:catechol 1,2-dioxygenase